MFKSTLFSMSLTSSSLVVDDAEIPSVDSSLSLTSTSLSTTLLCSCGDKTLESKVVDTNMLLESMSLEELYELRDLVDEKGNSYKLHM